MSHSQWVPDRNGSVPRRPGRPACPRLHPRPRPRRGTPVAGRRRMKHERDPWCIREDAVPHESLRQAESIFALSNGHIGLRGNLDEAEPCGMPGTYLNSLYEERELAHPEDGYAFPRISQSIIDAPNGKLIAVTVDGEPFDVRTGTVRRHGRTGGRAPRHRGRTGPDPQHGDRVPRGGSHAAARQVHRVRVGRPPRPGGTVRGGPRRPRRCRPRRVRGAGRRAVHLPGRLLGRG
jgi:hypothetical protein